MTTKSPQTKLSLYTQTSDVDFNLDFEVIPIGEYSARPAEVLMTYRGGGSVRVDVYTKDVHNPTRYIRDVRNKLGQ